MKPARFPLAPDVLDQAAMLLALQRQAFDYFLQQVNPANGLVRDKDKAGWPASIAAVGLALSSYCVGVERGYMTRRAAAARTLTTLRFFARSEQGDSPAATGHHGFYYHFLDMDNGRRAWACELSSIDTALLIAGVLTAAAYFDGEHASEREIRTLADFLYRRVDWQWMRARCQLLRHGWKPETGFLRKCWRGYDEALILYVLALGSPTFPIGRASYAAWTDSFEWKTVYGIDYLYAGSLFIHQMSHVWLDLRGIRDDFMRAHGLDYFENSRRATLVQQRYALDNPLGFPGYGEHGWGISASDGPGPASQQSCGVRRSFRDYAGRGAPYGFDDGTLAPWALAAALPFAPELVLPALAQQHDVFHARSTVFVTQQGVRWVSPWRFGINDGPVVLMLENHLHDFPWRLMRRSPYLREGLLKAGFAGGWLEQQSDAMAFPCDTPTASTVHYK